MFHCLLFATAMQAPAVALKKAKLEADDGKSVSLACFPPDPPAQPTRDRSSYPFVSSRYVRLAR